MPNFTAGTSFTDGVTNDVTALKLNALVADAVPTSSLALTSTNGTIANFTSSTANITLGTIPTLTAGTTTGTAGIFTSGTITTALIPNGTFGTTTSTAATITTGTIPTLTTGTTTSTNEVVTNGTITNLSATTSTFLGTITASTNTINVGNGQIIKDASGNVGISVSPVFKLQVSGDIGLTDTSSINFATASGTIRSSISGDSSENLKFQTVGTERLRIDSSGNIGVGVTPSSGFRLTSKGATATSAGYNLLCQNSSGSTCLLTRDDGLITTGLLANSPFNYTTGGAANAAIFSDGNLGRSTSSIKYKKDVVNTNHGLLDVMKLRPVTYRGKSENDGNTVFGGLIAEEVHDAGLTEFVQYADDGTPDALSYGNMVSLAFRAIQEQQATIEELKNKVAALEAA